MDAVTSLAWFCLALAMVAHGTWCQLVAIKIRYLEYRVKVLEERECPQQVVKPQQGDWA